jgi:predicted RNA-binding protein with PUA-like domain
MTNAWIFQGSPKIWDVVAGVNQLKQPNWSVRQHKAGIKVGDKVYIWVSGKDAGIVAIATVTSQPGYYADTPVEIGLYKGTKPPIEFQGKQLRVYLNIDVVLTRRITRTELLNHPTLQDLVILRMPRGTNFRVTPQQAHELEVIGNGRASGQLVA